VVCVVSQGLSQLPNCHSQSGVEVAEGIALPDDVLNLFAGNGTACAFHEDDEKTKRLILQPDPRPVLQQFAGGGIHLEWSELVGKDGLSFHQACLGVEMEAMLARCRMVYNQRI
jgi:hypothetical protein